MKIKDEARVAIAEIGLAFGPKVLLGCVIEYFEYLMKERYQWREGEEEARKAITFIKLAKDIV